jgi:hypothetical protein
MPPAGKPRPVAWPAGRGAYSALGHRGHQLTEVGNGLRRPDDDDWQESDHDLRPAAAGEAMAISIPRTETAVIRHFQDCAAAIDIRESKRTGDIALTLNDAAELDKATRSESVVLNRISSCTGS